MTGLIPTLAELQDQGAELACTGLSPDIRVVYQSAAQKGRELITRAYLLGKDSAEASEDFVITLDALLLTAATASPRNRTLLASCLMCRNSVLYLLDHPDPVRSGIHQRIRTRLEILEMTHESHSGDGPDSTRPRLRGITA